MKQLSPKICVVGAGNVGSSFAFALMISGIAREIVIVDRDEAKARGECMDLSHGLSLSKPAVISSGSFDQCTNADIVVITAGARQKPGQNRIDLVQANTDIFKDIVPRIQKFAPNALYLIVTNPVDILTYVTLKISKLPQNRVIGSGTVLDSSRFKYLISEHCEVDPRNVHAYIIGEHGDTELPVWSNATIGGINIKKYCAHCENNDRCEHDKVLDSLFEEVKTAAYKIIELKGATYYAIALALIRIVEAVIRNEHSVLPVSTLINDYYGISDVCLSIPSIVGNSGIEKFLKIELSQIEQKQLKHSADTLTGIIKQLKL